MNHTHREEGSKRGSLKITPLPSNKLGGTSSFSLDPPSPSEKLQNDTPMKGKKIKLFTPPHLLSNIFPVPVHPYSIALLCEAVFKNSNNLSSCLDCLPRRTFFNQTKKKCITMAPPSMTNERDCGSRTTDAVRPAALLPFPLVYTPIGAT